MTGVRREGGEVDRRPPGRGITRSRVARKVGETLAVGGHRAIDSNRRNPTSFGISFQLLRKTDVCTHCSAALKAATAPTLASGKVLPPTPPFFIGGKNPPALPLKTTPNRPGENPVV